MTKSRNTVIVGGGLLGVATLYELSRRGERVALLEANGELAAETSFANGGMLTASMPDPWNGPGVGRHLVSSLFDPGAAMKLRWKVIPGMAFWGLRFLCNSTTDRHREATKKNYTLAKRSVTRTVELTNELGLNYGASSVGTLKIFESAGALEAPKALSEALRPLGLRFDVLTPDEVVAREPELVHVMPRMACGIYYPDDTAGDACLFTRALAERAQANGAVIRTGHAVTKIVTRGGRVTGVETGHGTFDADSVVIAAGTRSPALSRMAGIRLAIKPVKGYSVTVDAGEWESKPTIPVVDDAMHAAVTPLGDRLRFVGTAEFTGYDVSIRQDRIDNLFALFERLYPHLSGQIDRGSAGTWAGLRPMSADGLPFIGTAGPDGLWFNTGHGHLGWTMAAGSAELLVSQMLREEPPVDPQPFLPTR